MSVYCLFRPFSCTNSNLKISAKIKMMVNILLKINLSKTVNFIIRKNFIHFFFFSPSETAENS